MIGHIGHKCLISGDFYPCGGVFLSSTLLQGCPMCLTSILQGCLSAPPACYFFVIACSGTGMTSFVGYSEI